MDKPSNIPLVPRLKVFFHAIRIYIDPIKEFTKMSRAYGDVFALGDANYFNSKGNKPIIFINDPNWVKHVFKDNQNNY